MQHKEEELRSRSYLLAVEDKEFLQRDELRAFRIALEFSKVDLALAEMGIRSTVVVLAARASPQQADKKAREARGAGARSVPGSRKHSIWYQEARNFGRIVSERGGSLHPRIVFAKRDRNRGGPVSWKRQIEGQMMRERRASALTSCFRRSRSQWLLDAKPHVSLPLFRRAEDAFRNARQRARNLPWWPRNDGRAVRNPDAQADTQERSDAHHSVLSQLLAKGGELRCLADLGMIDPEEFGLFDIVDNAEEAWDVMVKRGLTANTPLREP
jgi:hypothetical protein